MKFFSTVLLLLSLFLLALSQETEEVTPRGGYIRNGLGKMISTISSHVMPHVEDRKATLKNILEEHKIPLKENLQDFREAMNDQIMNVGLSVVEKSLDMAEILQNMTNRIKAEVLSLRPKGNIEVAKN